MNIRKLMNETLVATNGEMSRGLKNQLSLLPAFVDESIEDKLSLFKKEGISVFNYYGMRLLTFKLETIQSVLNENNDKLESYRANPQELVRDMRKSEMKQLNNLENNLIGGM